MPPISWNQIAAFFSGLSEYLSWVVVLGMVMSLLGFAISIWPPTKPLMKLGCFIVFLILTISLCIAAYRQGEQEKKDKVEAGKKADAVQQEIRDLMKAVEKSESVAAALRESRLDAEARAVAGELAAVNARRELVTSTAFGLDALEQAKKLASDADELKRRQAEIEKQQEQLRNQPIIQRREEQQKKRFKDEILPAFDYAVRKLHGMLDSLARDTKETISSDFAGPVPTLYNSKIVKDGAFIQNANNTIQLGTSQQWLFTISVSQTEPTEPIYLVIACNDGEKDHPTLSIFLEWEDKEFTLLQRIYGERGEHVEKRTYSRAPLSNYAPAIDEALQALLITQQEQFPLPKK